MPEFGLFAQHVFVLSFPGNQITQFNTQAWQQAQGLAGIEDFRWHDQNSTPLHVLQEMGGWESPEMVRRYAHLSAEHLAPYAERLSALRVVDVGIAPTEIPTGAQ